MFFPGWCRRSLLLLGFLWRWWWPPSLPLGFFFLLLASFYPQPFSWTPWDFFFLLLRFLLPLFFLAWSLHLRHSSLALACVRSELLSSRILCWRAQDVWFFITIFARCWETCRACFLVSPFTLSSISLSLFWSNHPQASRMASFLLLTIPWAEHNEQTWKRSTYRIIPPCSSF